MFNGFIAVQDWINGGELNINQLVSTAQNTGLLTSDQGQLANTVGTLINGLNGQQNANIVDAVGNVTQLNIPNAGSADIMNGLRSGLTAITDTDLADTIFSRGDLVENWDAMFQGNVDAGDMISNAVNNGDVSIEELLGIATQLQRDGNGAQAGDDCSISTNCSS